MVLFTVNSVSSFYPTGTSTTPTGSTVGSTSERTGAEGEGGRQGGDSFNDKHFLGTSHIVSIVRPSVTAIKMINSFVAFGVVYGML